MKYEVNYQTEECPVCKSNWLASIGPNGERYKRSFCHYSQEYDRTVAMSCPDCGVVFKIKIGMFMVNLNMIARTITLLRRK